MDQKSIIRRKIAVCIGICSAIAAATPAFSTAAAAELSDKTHAPIKHTTASLTQLCAALDSGSATQRIEALRALAVMGPAAAPAVTNIIDALNDNRSFAGTTKVASHISPQVTDAAIEALRRIGPKAAEASPYLVQMLGDRNELLRRQPLLQALDVVGMDASATKTVMRVVNEEGKFTKTRLLAISGLGKIDPPATEALDLLKQIAGDASDPVGKKTALAAISSIEARAAKIAHQVRTEDSIAINDAREKLGADRPQPERLAALENIENMAAKGAPFVPSLILLLNDPDEQVVRATQEALAGIGRPAISATPALVAKFLHEKEQDRRLELCRVISTIDPTGKLSIPMLQPALEDPFKARIALELLDELNTQRSSTIAAAARKRWCIK